MEIRIYRLTRWTAINWFPGFVFLYSLFVVLPFIAPLFMHLGWNSAGRMVYFIYSFLCHQLPERSHFLFGPKLNYPLTEIQSVWNNSFNPLVLGQFIGNHPWAGRWLGQTVWFRCIPALDFCPGMVPLSEKS